MEHEDILVQEYLDGNSVINIAKERGITREAVYQHLRQLPNWQKVSDSMKPTKKQRAENKYRYAVAEILKLSEQGYSAVQISEKLKVPFYSVQNILKGTRFDNRKQVRHERNRQIYELYQQGNSQQQIATAFGMAQSSISEIIRKWDSNKTSK